MTQDIESKESVAFAETQSGTDPTTMLKRDDRGLYEPAPPVPPKGEPTRAVELPEVVPFLCDKGMVVWQNDYDRLLAAHERQQIDIETARRMFWETVEEVKRLQERIRGLNKDVNDLNNVLRAAGWGQGEIDSAAEMLDKAEKGLEKL